MKKWMLFFYILLFHIYGNSQSLSDSLLSLAQERYPMLEVCQVPGFPETTLCGTLEVYENHEENKGNKIPIEVVVFPAKSATPASSAFTFHWGGNGGAAKSKLWYFSQAGVSESIRVSRDIVLIDDRGTGASNIRCASMDSLQPYSYAFAYDENLILDCLKEVENRIDLELYNTPAVVNDYELVRKWLGLEQFDFYGISYGVRVGLEYMRRFPDRTRTLIVQGCVPPGFNYVNEMDVAIQEQLEILFEHCKSDSICQAIYPNFQAELYEIRDRLKEEPIQIEYQLENGGSATITMDDLLFRRIVGHLILSGDSNEALPLIIHRAYGGNYAPLIVAGGNLMLDMPVFLSQFCPEEVHRFDYQKDWIKSKQLFTQGAIAEEKKFACRLWQQLPSAEWLDEPLVGESPILILTGENDANTPVRMGEQIKQAFPQSSRHIILPFQGHGGMENTCRFNIISQFVNTKDILGIDTSCLSSIQPNLFSYELDLLESEFEKYAGVYKNEDPTKMLKLFRQNGIYYLMDEFSRWSGPSQLLYKGEHTFSLVDCDHCKIQFEMEQGKPVRVRRIYREEVIFEPENN